MSTSAQQSIVRSHRDLEVWQVAMQLAQGCFEAAKRLPASERYGLGDQMRRAAASIPANIAEGLGRSGRRDFRRYVSIASGEPK
jgi:four helix bundle protein